MMAGFLDSYELAKPPPPPAPPPGAPASFLDAYEPAPTAGAPKAAEGFVESVQAGLQGSAIGLAVRGKLPDLVMDPNNASWWERLATGVSGVAADLPIMIPAGAAGAAAGTASGGPVGGILAGGAAMFAAPAGIRTSLMEIYKSQAGETPADWFNIVRETAKSMIHEGAIGAATFGAGAVARGGAAALMGASGQAATAVGLGTATMATKGASKVAGTADVAAQIAAMVTMPAALEGRLPEKREFLDAAAVILTLKGAHVALENAGVIKTTAQRIANVYERTGKTPAEQLADAQADPNVANELTRAANQEVTGTTSGIPLKLDRLVAEAQFLARGGVPEAPNLKAIIKEIKEAGPLQGDMVRDLDRMDTLSGRQDLNVAEKAEFDALTEKFRAQAETAAEDVPRGTIPPEPPPGPRFAPDQLTEAAERARTRLEELAAKSTAEALTDAERAERIGLTNAMGNPEALAKRFGIEPSIRVPTGEERDASTKAVYDDVLRQLREADEARAASGLDRLGDAHAMGVASIISREARTYGEMLGRMPEDVYRERYLTIRDGSDRGAAAAEAEPPPVAPPDAPRFVPPEVDLFGNPILPEVLPRLAEEGLATVEVPLANLRLSKEVPQFKKDANAAGVIVPLGGKFDRTGVGPIQVWERLDGSMEVISGRHRLDLARRSGEETIPAQIHREADGYTARQAATLDAQLNIREEQGSVADYAQYFKDSGITKDAAEQRGLLARAKGRTGWTISRDGSLDLVAAHRAGLLSDEAALVLSQTAPGSERLQALGIAMVNDGKSILYAANMMRSVDLMASERMAAGAQGDIFGFDDSAMIEAAAMAKKASSAQRKISEQISAVSGASKRPELARKMGVDVEDPEGIQKKIAELKQEQYQWDNWPLYPELVAKLRGQELHQTRRSRFERTPAGPVLRAAEIDIADPFFQYAVEGVEVHRHSIETPDGKPAGEMALGWKGDQIVELVNIVAEPQLAGIGERVIRAILSHNNPDTKLLVSNIQPEARAFWEKMGAQLIEREGRTDGLITRETYNSSRPVSKISADRGPDQGTQGLPSDAGGQDAGRTEGDAGGKGGGTLYQDDFELKPETPAELKARDAEAVAAAKRKLAQERAGVKGPVPTVDQADLFNTQRTLFQSAPPVDSEPFKRWFGESKVTDKDGKPLVVYHGTADNITAFDLNHPNRQDSGWLGTGVYMTTSPELANSYANLKRGGSENVLPLYAKLDNPYRATQRDKERFMLISHNQGIEAGRAAADAWTKELKDKGHDGVILVYTADKVGKANASTEIVVFDPAGVKSAIGNRGTFDPNNPNILFQQANNGMPINPDALSKEVLSKIDRALKAMGYDSRGTDDVLTMLKTRIAPDGVVSHPDWLKAYEQATGSVEKRKATQAAKALEKEKVTHVDFERIRELGTTADIREAGYITPAGSFIDLSGKREGGQPGTRAYDHREAGGTDGMQEFMALGNIRMDHNAGTMDLAKEPTPEQYRKIAQLAQSKNGEVVIDLERGLGDYRDGHYGKSEGAFSREYPPGTKPARIMADIQRYYAGEEPLPLRPLYQEPGQERDGQHLASYSVADRIVTLFEQANKSSVIHEVGHHFLENLKHFASQPNAPERVRAMWETARREFAIGEDGDISTASHEMNARSFERYLGEGKAPSIGLRAVFEQFKTWMLEIYQNLQNLGVNINPEIRSLFDKMLATDQEIADARAMDVPRAYVPEARAAAAERIVPPAPEGRKIEPSFAAEKASMEPYADELPPGPGTAPADSHINYAYINSPMDVKLAMQRMAEIDQANIQKQRGGTQGVKSWAEANAEQAKYVNDILGGSEDTLRILSPRDPDAAGPDVKLGILKKLAVGAAKDSARLRDIVLEAGHDATVRQQLEYMGSIERARMIQAEFLGERAGVARALNALKDVTEGTGEIARMLDAIGYGEAAGRELFQAARTPAEEQAYMRLKLDEILQNYKGRTVLDIAKLHKEIGTLKGTFKFSKAVTAATKWEMVVEGWRSSILSGPVTHTTNLFGTEGFHFLRPAVDALAATIGMARGASPGMGESDRASMSEAVARLGGMMSGIKDGVKVAVATFKLDDPTGKTEAYRTAIPGRAGELIRIPLRLMGAEDALVTTMYRRGELATLAIRQAFDEQMNPNTREFADRVSYLKDHPTPEMEAAADSAATRMTFNSPLGEKGVALQLFVNKWNLQWMIPFIRTPINITKEVARMTPLAPLVGEWRAAIAKGGVERDRALAELALGSGIMALTMAMAFEGTISGAGSPDPGKNRGKVGVWQPYSRLIGDTWYEYARFQPVGTLVGMAADVATIWDHMNDEEKDKIPKLLAVAFSNAVTNQTFLQGITNVINAMSEPTRFLPRFANQMAGSMVPNIIAQPTAMADPVVREVNGMLEAIQARLPGARQELLPKRDWLGEPVQSKERTGVVMPIREQKVSEDKVRLEAARLDISMAQAPKKTHIGKGTGKLGDVPLTPEERNTFAKVGGEMAHKILDNIVNAPGYDQIPDLVKRKIFAKVIQSSHQVAAVAALPMDKRIAYIQSISEKMTTELAPEAQ